MIQRILWLYVSLALSWAAFGANINFSNNPLENPTIQYGFNREETYDVAIFLDQPELYGCEINTISVPLAGNPGISNTSIWLSSELNLKRVNGRNVNAPDILSVDVEVSDGVLKAELTEPYILTGPIYVGYSFTVEELGDATSMPVNVVSSYVPGGLWIHTSRTHTKWVDKTSEGLASVLSLDLTGSLKDNAGAFLPANDVVVDCEGGGTVSLNFANHGSTPVYSISGIYSIAGRVSSFDHEFTHPVEGNYGVYEPVPFDISDLKTYGSFEFSVKVTEVNGSFNQDVTPETIIPMEVYPFIPVNRPLVEEYTGMWCGFCPRGYVALETMREAYPEQFVALAYHNRDVLEYVTDTPSSPSNYPSAYINRGSVVDPSAIYSMWPTVIKNPVPVRVTASINRDEDTIVGVEATTAFIKDYATGSYGVSFVLVADGLSNPTWLQSNSYAPRKGQEPVDDPQMPGKLGSMFTHGSNPMSGLIYNDVVLSIT
ncbi:MAG: hypothetical protein K2H86_05460, partial [Muribaculaceae bacterium]|nr:hypothetical protein [Muribaculaceae bacterium]